VQAGKRQAEVLGKGPAGGFNWGVKGPGVRPLSVGRVIVATRHPHETTVIEVLRDLGLELQVIFNKGAVMVLPSGINKAAGLSAALAQLGLSPHNVAGIGDAENDHAFMSLCECAVAVSNALPMVQERADYVTAADHGAGVVELIHMIVAGDLAELAPRLERHQILLGARSDGDGQQIYLEPYGTNLLLTGSSGGGKSTLGTAILERLAEQQYQFCIIDPEGDYESFDGAVVLGDPSREPSIDAIMDLLEKSQQNAIVNMLGIGIADRPAFFE